MRYKIINFPSECCCHGSAADLYITCVLTTRDFRILCLQNLLTEDIFFKNSMANFSKLDVPGVRRLCSVSTVKQKQDWTI